MKISFWNPRLQYLKIKNELDKAIQDFLVEGKWVLGYSEDIEKFEKRFAEYIGTKYCVMTGGGTHSLFLAYKALGIGLGDEVIVPSMTYIATIDQIVACGGTPVLVDIGEDGLIDPVEVEKAITPRTKAIVPVHLEGKVCDMEFFSYLEGREALGQQKIFIIDDTAQAIGAQYKPDKFPSHKKIGGITSHIGCFSFYPAKILGSVGNAGAITTNDENFAKKIALMRNHFHVGKGPLEDGDWGYNLEPDGIQAAVLNIRMNYLEQNLARRKEIAERYLRNLRESEYQGLIKLPIEQKGRVWQDFVIRIPERKEEFIKYLNDNEIEVIGHNLTPNHYYPRLGLTHHKLPKTELYLKEQVRIPCNDTIDDEQVEWIIKVIKDFYVK